VAIIPAQKKNILKGFGFIFIISIISFYQKLEHLPNSNIRFKTQNFIKLVKLNTFVKFKKTRPETNQA